MHVIQLTYLGEHARHSIVHSISNSPRPFFFFFVVKNDDPFFLYSNDLKDTSLPVVAPFDERAGLERIAAHLVDVGLVARQRLAPERERQAHLVGATIHELGDLSMKLLVVRVGLELLELGRVVEVVLEAPQVHELITLADLRAPRAAQLQVRTARQYRRHKLDTLKF